MILDELIDGYPYGYCPHMNDDKVKITSSDNAIKREIVIDSKGVHLSYDGVETLDDEILIAVLKTRGYEITKKF